MKIRGLTLIAIVCTGLLVWLSYRDFALKYLIESMCLSYLAAYVFYFLNVYLVDRSERKVILPFVSRNVINIIINNHSIVNCLLGDAKLSIDYYPQKGDYKELLLKVNPKDKTPYYYKNENWIYLFRNRQKSTCEAIDRILLSGKHVDDELRRILLEINNSLYLKEDYAFNSVEFDKENLQDYHLVFFNYFSLINRLKVYYDKNLKSYYQTANSYSA